MVIHNSRTVDKTGYLILVMVEKRMVGNYQKLKTDLAVIPLQGKYCHKTESESK